eukprot:jgi/Mesvir1/9168/Mv25429-RA.1
MDSDWVSQTRPVSPRDWATAPILPVALPYRPLPTLTPPCPPHPCAATSLACIRARSHPILCLPAPARLRLRRHRHVGAALCGVLLLLPLHQLPWVQRSPLPRPLRVLPVPDRRHSGCRPLCTSCWLQPNEVCPRHLLRMIPNN